MSRIRSVDPQSSSRRPILAADPPGLGSCDGCLSTLNYRPRPSNGAPPPPRPAQTTRKLRSHREPGCCADRV